MKILVINPNTSETNRQILIDTLAPYQEPDTVIDVVNAKRGPEGLESYYHKQIQGAEILPMVKKAEEDGYDGVVIACYGDPGTADSSVPRIERFIRQLGLNEELGEVRAINPGIAWTIVDSLMNREKSKQLIIKACKNALEESNAELIILGCSEMSEHAAAIQKELGIPVIDPVVTAVQLTIALIKMNLAQSKHLCYQKPPEFKMKE
ncbi:MAG: aspartate/glutamate racemase family protein [Candidatus Hodarchaeota archaeon]